MVAEGGEEETGLSHRRGAAGGGRRRKGGCGGAALLFPRPCPTFFQELGIGIRAAAEEEAEG